MGCSVMDSKFYPRELNAMSSTLTTEKYFLAFKKFDVVQAKKYISFWEACKRLFCIEICLKKMEINLQSYRLSSDESILHIFPPYF